MYASPEPYVRLNQNLVGCITVTLRFRIVKMIQFGFPMAAILKFFKLCQIEPTHEMETENC